MRTAVGIAVFALAGCEVLFPHESSERDAPPGTLDDGGPPPTADADPAEPDAGPPLRFCAQATTALFCADFEGPPSGLEQLTVSAPFPGAVVDELPPDGATPTGTMRAALAPETDSMTATYANASGRINTTGFYGRMRLKLRAGQVISAPSCEPATVQVWIGPSVQIALQAVGPPNNLTGYRLILTDNINGQYQESPTIEVESILWQDVEIVVDTPGAEVLALINGTSRAVNGPGIQQAGEVEPIDYYIGLGLYGLHSDCAFRFDDVTWESLK